MNKNILNYAEIGKRIKEKRVQSGLTITQLAAASGIERCYLSNLERGYKQIGLATLALIAKTLNADIDYFVFGSTYREDDECSFRIDLSDCSKEGKEAIVKIVSTLLEVLTESKKN